MRAGHRNWYTFWDAFWLMTFMKCDGHLFDQMMILTWNPELQIHIYGYLEADNDNLPTEGL